MYAWYGFREPEVKWGHLDGSGQVMKGLKCNLRTGLCVLGSFWKGVGSLKDLEQEERWSQHSLEILPYLVTFFGGFRD